MKKEVLHTLMYKAFRGLLAGLTGVAITKGYMTSGQTEYVLEAAVGFLAWAGSAFVGSVKQHLKAVILHRTDPNAHLTFAEIRAAANSAFYDLVTNYVRNFKAKEKSDEATK